MTKLEIRQEAKKLVARHGPFNVLEFGMEYIEQDAMLTKEVMTAIDDEAQRQANRVLDFLGL